MTNVNTGQDCFNVISTSAYSMDNFVFVKKNCSLSDLRTIQDNKFYIVTGLQISLGTIIVTEVD